MDVKCFQCGKKYVPNAVNVKIYGPYMETTCPFCLYKYEGKLLNYVNRQIGDYKPLNLINARTMQTIAQFVELNSSEYYSKKGLRYGK
jgi:hypothetical protein